MKTKYIWLMLLLLGFASCANDDDATTPTEPAVELTAGTADFSRFVSLGNSLTAGFQDNALFIAAQQSSFPNLAAQKFGLLGGGTFTQPLMNDNIGGLLFNGFPNPQFGPRLAINPLTTEIGPVSGTPSTEVFAPSNGPYNNLGVPGAKSFHLLFDGYGNPANLPLGLANPYYVRMASSPSATIIGEAMAQQPTFFSLWIGNNDVLGYAISGGDGSNPITPSAGPPGIGFDETIGFIISTLTSGGAKGVVANIPDVTSIPFFTTVTHDVIPLDEATADAVNSAYAPYNGGLQLALLNGLISEEEAAYRTIQFVESANNSVVIEDESLTDLSGLGLPNYRQATADDLFVLTSASFIGTEAIPGNPLTVNGVAIPLADKWVLLPSEQQEIKAATAAFNGVIESAAQNAGLALADANNILNQISNGSYSSGNFIFTSGLVLGGIFSLDGVHPHSRGNAIMANEFLKAIDATYGSTFEASGNLYDPGEFPTNFPASLQ